MTTQIDPLAALRRLRSYEPPDVSLAEDYLYLAEPQEAWEKILSRIPATQRDLVKLDDAAAARVVASYQSAREELAADIDRRWKKIYGAGANPTPDERVRFVTSQDTLEQLTARQADLVNGPVAAINHVHDQATILAWKNSATEKALMAQSFPVLQHFDPFKRPPGPREEIYVNKAVQDATHIAQQTRDAVSKELVTSALVGEGPDAMRRRITPIFDGNRRRAELTTRYVSIRSFNEATQTHYGQLKDTLAPYGRVVYKMWIATENDRTCPICLALHGTIVGVEDNFDLHATFDTKPPGKPWPEPDILTEPPRHARCRCTTAPWVDGWQHGTAFTPEAMQAEARRLAQAAGYTPTPRQPITSQAVPRPDGPRMHAHQIRQLPRDRFEEAKRRYLACVYPQGPPS